MMRILPNWYSKMKEELDRVVIKVCNEQNLDYSLASDSIRIEECKDGIVNSLVYLFDKGYWNIPPDDFKSLREAMKKENRRLKQHGKNKSKKNNKS